MEKWPEKRLKEREISKIISQKLNNSAFRKGLISVTSVDTTPDFKYARVYVSMINGGNKKEVLKALKKSRRFFAFCLA